MKIVTARQAVRRLPVSRPSNPRSAKSRQLNTQSSLVRWLPQSRPLNPRLAKSRTAPNSEQLGQMAASIETLEYKMGQIKTPLYFFYNIFLYIFDFFIIFHIFLHFLHMFPGIQPQAKEMIDLRNIVPNPRPCTKKKHRNLHGHIGDQKVNQFGAGRLGNSILTLILMIILVDISCFQPLQRAARIWRKQEFENSTYIARKVTVE